MCRVASLWLYEQTSDISKERKLHDFLSPVSFHGSLYRHHRKMSKHLVSVLNFFFLKKKGNKSTKNKISAKRRLDRAFSLNMWLLLMKFIAKSLGPQLSLQQSACQAHRRTQAECPATTDCKSSWGNLQRTRHPDIKCYSPVLTYSPSVVVFNIRTRKIKYSYFLLEYSPGILPTYLETSVGELFVLKTRRQHGRVLSC